nr:BTAD domain-containing putative transcriptional regulator [Streptomyces sp. DSM 41633]
MMQVGVLGPLDVRVGGRPVTVGRRHARTVLGILLSARGRNVPVDRLVDVLWTQRTPAKPTTSLHSYVSNLRGILEPDRPARTPSRILVSSPEGYALRLDDDAVDAWRFESAVRRARAVSCAEAGPLLDEALGLWRGDAYGEWGPGSWADGEIARLDELLLMAHELAMASSLGVGRPHEVVPTAEAHVRRHPLREEGWRLLALSLWATGRPGVRATRSRRCGARPPCAPRNSGWTWEPGWSSWRGRSSAATWMSCRPRFRPRPPRARPSRWSNGHPRDPCP